MAIDTRRAMNLDDYLRWQDNKLRSFNRHLDAHDWQRWAVQGAILLFFGGFGLAGLIFAIIRAIHLYF